jgi:metal iron transporter
MSEPKSSGLSPAPSDRELHDPKVLNSVTATPVYHQKGWWNSVKSVLLAKAPAQDAPLEFGGHRIAEEPRKKGFAGVISKFARFLGPGMIITVAYVDPDNFQTSLGDGQDFGYKMLFMVLFSLVLAIYLQVCVLY